ncbi:MAG: hypothetical protein K2U26_00965, partial [Cyclobacteriaceae bacterium]|nr:hypothetical protein [Cyclobacteriaceae bacterium]
MKLRFILFIVLAFAGWSSAYAQRYLWGMTPSGGSDDKGVIFKIQDDGTGYSLQHSFTIDVPGALPQGSLCLAGGKLYGLTSSGGANNQGILFEYDPATEVFTKKVDFSPSNGSYPNGSLVLASDGNLYGMTYSGGLNDVGVIFRYNPTTSSYSKLFDLSSANGGNPLGSLIQAANGLIYGLT